MTWRLISAVAVAAAIGALSLSPPLARQAVILAAALYASHEAVRLAATAFGVTPAGAAPRAGHAPEGGFGLLAGAIPVLCVAASGANGATFLPEGFPAAVAGALLLLALGVVALRLPHTREGLAWLGAAAVTAVWIGIPAAALLRISGGADGGAVLLFLIGTVMLGEAGAWAGGKAIGGPRLAARLSPGKTWAGFVSQLIAGGAAAVLGASLLPSALPTGTNPILHFALGGALAAAAALGDLFESYWKRAAGRKDSGRLIPGHGGALDRIDGVLFAAVVFEAARPLILVP